MGTRANPSGRSTAASAVPELSPDSSSVTRWPDRSEAAAVASISSGNVRSAPICATTCDTGRSLVDLPHGHGESIKDFHECLLGQAEGCYGWAASALSASDKFVQPDAQLRPVLQTEFATWQIELVVGSDDAQHVVGGGRSRRPVSSTRGASPPRAARIRSDASGSCLQRPQPLGRGLQRQARFGGDFQVHGGPSRRAAHSGLSAAQAIQVAPTTN